MYGGEFVSSNFYFTVILKSLKGLKMLKNNYKKFNSPGGVQSAKY